MTATSATDTTAAAVSGRRAAPEDTAELPRIEDASAVAPRDARELTKLFLRRLAELEEGTREHQYARNTLIEMNLSLVRYAAKGFRHSGDMEDIVQVGTIGLIKAIDRFELSREVEFSSFAVPYVIGEIKRFFRDSTWAVHVPRRLQELRLRLAKAREHLSTRLGREATVAELAGHLGIDEEEVLEGLVAGNCYTANSLDVPTDGADPDSSTTYADLLGEEDPALEMVENLHALAPLLKQLDDRDRKIIALRFGRELSQAEIGAEVGCSQMHVSRLLARALRGLRENMLA
ncbi:SigB/SigF/SigG family RNA polymerase sigma factor [Streptomyces sp. NPDC058739]|uniref:SigB/SigF/SigG family RNA polymerase sigma factor n=1 Tax=Streptomyces sp. NPDC058739 TaxID=3346618 RepID=UPI0036B88729